MTSDDRDEEEFRRDPLVRLAARALDPLHNTAVRPAHVTAAQIIASAEQRYHAPVRRRWWFAAPALVGMAVIAVVLAVTFSRDLTLPQGTGEQTGSGTRTDILPLILPYQNAAPPAQAQIVALRDRTAALPAPAVRGRYTYINTQTWSLDITSSDPAQGALHSQQLWWAEDRSGRDVVTDLDNRNAQPMTTDYAPGQLTVIVEAPAPEAHILASQLSDHQDFESGPQARLRAVVDLYRYHVLSPAQRAAALQVLADTSELVLRGSVTDKGGRKGIAFSVDSDGGATRDVAVFDPDSGVLLSYEQVMLLNKGHSTVRPPAVISSVLFLDAGYTQELGEPPAADSPADSSVPAASPAPVDSPPQR